MAILQITARIRHSLTTWKSSETHQLVASPITYAETLSNLKRAHRGQRLDDLNP